MKYLNHYYSIYRNQVDEFSIFFQYYKNLFNNSNHKNKYKHEDGCSVHDKIYPGTTNSFKSDCITCMKYLEYLDDDISNEKEQKQGIIYLYFWLRYYELQNNINNVKTLDSINTLMDSYEKISSNYSNIQNVYNNHIKSILNDELNVELNNELSDLFYIYEKFDNFQKNKVCTDTKCTCAKECVQKYMSSIKKCSTYRYFCNELEKFRKKYNDYKISETDCPEVDSYLPSYRNFSTSVIILISFITISVLSSLLFILYKVIAIFIYLFIVQ
ncbi:hypothetical protein PVBG_05920 [Plasmodium vivax Brazil I]|uniref:Variable surface protein n=1 Tax=Plasmodium vivax (strain Brazil I) TaxID=1033975 RepID=A0A0J9T2T5_PLAV1|nr:hypothetical protein PVBG_05920 [Plasmodium vivax Brazil I]